MAAGIEKISGIVDSFRFLVSIILVCVRGEYGCKIRHNKKDRVKRTRSVCHVNRHLDSILKSAEDDELPCTFVCF